MCWSVFWGTDLAWWSRAIKLCRPYWVRVALLWSRVRVYGSRGLLLGCARSGVQWVAPKPSSPGGLDFVVCGVFRVSLALFLILCLGCVSWPYSGTEVCGLCPGPLGWGVIHDGKHRRWVGCFLVLGSGFLRPYDGYGDVGAAKLVGL